MRLRFTAPFQLKAAPYQLGISLVKRAAGKLNLVPRSMKGKEWLKRVFYGELFPLPPSR